MFILVYEYGLMYIRHQVFGELLDQYPQYSSRVKGWRQSSFHYQAAANFNSARKKNFLNVKKDFAANPAVTALVDNPQLTPYRPANIIYKFQRFVGKGVVRAVLMNLGKDVSLKISSSCQIRQSKLYLLETLYEPFSFRKKTLRKM